VLLAAGDIAACSSPGDNTTADMLDSLPGTVVTLGDNVYENGTAAEFANCYEPTWGRHKTRTLPSVGNHEYNTPGATGYYGYFGAAAGDPSKGYYSFDLGAWHLIALNSNCAAIGGTVAGGCGAQSPQVQWLRDDLAAHPRMCTLAYLHHPRFSSGTSHGDNSGMTAIWQALYDYGAEILLAGHEHNYERFAPQTAAGAADPAGVVEFVVGTGGRGHSGFGATKPNSVVRNSDAFGVLELTLDDTGYSWEFIAEPGKTFTDSGSASCHSNDYDDDTVVDEVDNCLSIPNVSQANTDAAPIDNGPHAPGDDITVVRGDGVGDACDADDDNDGIDDGSETGGPPCGSASQPTDPLDMDSDGDHLADGWECSRGSDPADAASKAFGTGTVDADGDHIIDNWEMRGYGGSASSDDADGDGCHDMVELGSVDGDRNVDDGDRISVARAALDVWPPDEEQDYAFDIDKNGAVHDADRIFVARAALLPGWLPKSCP
jgi:hypothetical protein